MYLNYIDSLWDEKSWGLDSFLSTSSLYKIQSGWTSYGSFSGSDYTDYYQISVGAGGYRLVVTSDPLNASGFPGTWGAGAYYFDIEIRDSLGNVLLDADLIGPDIYTDSITFTSYSYGTYYVKITNTLFSSFNYAATLEDISSIDVTPPTIALGTSDANLTIGETATITFTLSEPSTDFLPSDVVFYGGTLSNFVSSSSTSYSATFTPSPNSITDGSVIVYSGAFADMAGNANIDGADANNRVAMTINTMPPGQYISGSASSDNLYGTSGNDTFDGGAGVDSVNFAGLLYDYTLSKTAQGYLVSDGQPGRDGTDTLLNVEKLVFNLNTVNLTVQAAAVSVPYPEVQRIAELYVAFFNRIPDADGMEYWINQHKSGLSINGIAEAFYNAGVFYSDLTGFSSSMSNADFVNVVYRNVLGRSEGADADGLAFWSGALARGEATHGSLVSAILDSAHTFKGNATWGWVADLLDNKIEVAETVAIDWGLNYSTPELSIAMGMAIADAVTPVGIVDALALVGVNPDHMHI